MSGTNNPPKPASENTLRERLKKLEVISDLDTVLQGEFSNELEKEQIDKYVDEILQAFTAAMETIIGPRPSDTSRENGESWPDDPLYEAQRLIDSQNERLAEMVGKTKEGENI